MFTDFKKKLHLSNQSDKSFFKVPLEFELYQPCLSVMKLVYSALVIHMIKPTPLGRRIINMFRGSYT